MALRPSQTVEVIGDSIDDYAIAVMIEGKSKAMWIAENLKFNAQEV